MKCVQKQLGEIGFPAGEVDGRISPETLSAYERLQAMRGERRFGLPLDTASAMGICRQLGVENRSLRVFWPSFQRRFTVEFEPALSARFRGTLRETVSDSINALNRLFDMRLTGTVAVVVASSRSELWRLLQSRGGALADRREFDRLYDISCGQDQISGGLADYLTVAICFPGGEIEPRPHLRSPDSQAAADWAQVRQTLLHGIFHAGQFQLQGIGPTDTPLADVGIVGPQWLLEGAAVYAVVRATFAEEFIPGFFSELRNQIGTTADILPKLVSSEAREKNLNALYEHGALAAYILASAHGDESLVAFYRNMGMGMTWKEAFREAFGIGVDAFHREYAEHR